VVALDGSKYSEHVVECTRRIFPKADEVTLVQAYGYSPVPEQICGVLGGPIFPEDEVHETNQTLQTLAKEKASKNLRKYSQQMENLGRKPDNLVVMLAEPQEKAKYALLKYVEKVKPDFLVCGSRGMGAMGRMLLGSTSDFLAHSASCSVVIVKGEPKAKEIDVDVLVDEGEENAVAEGKEEKDSS